MDYRNTRDENALTNDADYGIDAPGVVRNLLVIGGALLIVAIASFVGLIPHVLTVPPGIRINLLPSTFPPAAALIGTGLWMYLGGKYGKIREREKVISRIDWNGDERVLDVGCGRGLILVGAALRLTTGSAVGIDIWRAEDLSDNRADVPLRNAALEGVAQRVSVETADMRNLPFSDGSFDVILSRAAIHNLDRADDRARAIREIARVMKPGGRAVISDIRHHPEYRRAFAEAGCKDVRLLDSQLASTLWTIVTFGALKPNTLLVTK